MPIHDLSAVPCPWGTAPSYIAERYLHAHDFQAIAGLDEVGRGCLAGPVVAAAVILPLDDDIESRLAGVRDSKQVTAPQRNILAVRVQSIAVTWSIGLIAADKIDAINILQATKQAMVLAIEGLSLTPDMLLLDAITISQSPLPQLPLIKGDQRSLSIAAASIVAKVYRDQLMLAMDQQYPGYGFAKHKGYGTPQHLAALRKLGPCPQHRYSFAPIRNLADPPQRIESPVLF